MNVVENAAAGLIVATLIWLARWTRRRWLHRRHDRARRSHTASAVTTITDPAKEQHAMGSPEHLTRPDLKPGAHRELIELMHNLHRQAKYPSLRSMAKRMKEEMDMKVSTTTLSNAMKEPTLAAKSTYAGMAQQLVAEINWGQHGDPEAMADRIDRQVSHLWERASYSSRPPTDIIVRNAVREVWHTIGDGHGPDSVPREVVEAVRRSDVLTVDVDGKVVWVMVSTLGYEEVNVLDGDSESSKRWQSDFERLVSTWLDAVVHVGLIVHPWGIKPRAKHGTPAVRT
jgi:hypothetical protein